MITLIPGIGSRFAQAFVVSMNWSQARLALVGALLLAFIGSAVIAGPLGAEPVFPVKIGPTGRYLVDQNGVPFLVAGESLKVMIGNLSGVEAEMFLANREAHGFNTVLMDLLCVTYTGCRDDGSTFDGIVPFTQQFSGTWVPALTLPKQEHFARPARIRGLAAQYDFLVLLDPAETGGWLSVLRANGVDRSRQFGRYLGQRYANVPHLVWFHGNDYGDTTEANDEVVTAVALGIREFDTQHLHTVLFNTSFDDPPVLSTDDPRWLPIIDLNAAYSYQATHNVVLRGYTYAPPMPVFLAESGYEFENIAGFGTAPRNLRAQEYWALLSGASGQVYGNRYTWQFAQGWRDQLDTPGAVQMAYLMALFAPRRWYDLVPDQAHTLVTARLGTFDTPDYVTAARTPDGTLAMAYVPSARALTVDMSRLSGPVTGRWYDPASGSFATILGSPLANSGLRVFATPGNNADGDEDWVLVLEASPVSAALMIGPTPGSTLAGTTVTFFWTAAAGATQYWLDVGTTGAGSTNVYSQSQGLSLSGTVNGLPIDGSAVYVRLWTRLGGTRQLNDSTYRAAKSKKKATQTPPPPGSAGAGARESVGWGAGVGGGGGGMLVGSRHVRGREHQSLLAVAGAEPVGNGERAAYRREHGVRAPVDVVGDMAVQRLHIPRGESEQGDADESPAGILVGGRDGKLWLERGDRGDGVLVGGGDDRGREYQSVLAVAGAEPVRDGERATHQRERVVRAAVDAGGRDVAVQ